MAPLDGRTLRATFTFSGTKHQFALKGQNDASDEYSGDGYKEEGSQITFIRIMLFFKLNVERRYRRRGNIGCAVLSFCDTEVKQSESFVGSLSID